MLPGTPDERALQKAREEFGPYTLIKKLADYERCIFYDAYQPAYPYTGGIRYDLDDKNLTIIRVMGTQSIS